MGGQTIRDVVIKVAIENGNMSLGPLDTSGFEKQIGGAISRLQKQLSDLQMPVMNAAASQPAAGSAFQNAGAAGASQQSSSNGIKIGRPGYGASVDAGAAEVANKALAAMHSSGHMDGMNESSLQTLHAKLTQKAKPLVREQDRETSTASKDDQSRTKQQEREAKSKADEEAKAVKKAAEAHKEYHQAASAAAGGAVEFAKGLALIAASGSEADEAMVRNIVAIQGYFNLMQGGLNTLNAFKDAMRLRGVLSRVPGGAGTAGAAAPAGATGDGGGIPSTPSIPPGAMKALMNPWVALAAAALATGIAIRQLGVWTRERADKEKKNETTHRQIHEHAANETVGRHVSQSLRLIDAVPNHFGLKQTLANQQNRSATEKLIQKEQGESTRDFGAKQEIRERREKEQSLDERMRAAVSPYLHANEKLKLLGTAKEKLAEDKKSSKGAHDQTIKSITKEYKEQPQLPKRDPLPPHPPLMPKNTKTWKEWREKMGNNAWENVNWQAQSVNRKMAEAGDVIAPAGSMLRHTFTGSETTSQIRQQNLGVGVKMHEAQEGRAAQENAEKEEGIRLDEMELALTKQKAESAAAMLDVLREQARTKRQNYEQDKQTVASANQHLGGMTKGMQIRAQQLEAKRKAGIAFTQSDKEFGATLHDTKVADAVREQNEKEGEALGIEKSPDIKKSKKEAEESESKLNEKEAGLMKDMATNTDKSGELSDKIVNDMKDAFKLEDIAKRLTELGQAQKQFVIQAIEDLKSALQL